MVYFVAEIQMTPGSTKKGWAAFVDLVAAIPWVGPPLSFVLKLDKKIGLSLIIGFALGVCLALALVYLGVLPYFKADESVWRWVTEGVLALHKKPAAVSFTVVPQPTDWRRTYERELQDEGEKIRKTSSTGAYHYETSALEVTLPATTAFALVLTPAPGYSLSGYAFRETSVQPEEQLVEPLHRSESQQNGAQVLRIQIPRCEAGDKVHIVLKADSSVSPRTDDFRQTFQTSIE
jgi:hypothetical protein